MAIDFQGADPAAIMVIREDQGLGRIMEWIMEWIMDTYRYLHLHDCHELPG
jgi:hypothetical protein